MFLGVREKSCPDEGHRVTFPVVGASESDSNSSQESAETSDEFCPVESDLEDALTDYSDQTGSLSNPHWGNKPFFGFVVPYCFPGEKSVFYDNYFYRRSSPTEKK